MSQHERKKSKSKLAQALQRAAKGTDAITIGSQTTATGENKVRTKSMADVATKVDGIKYLVPGWIPFAMLTMLLAPAGVGKSAFALYALARTIILRNCTWFSGTKGPVKPGFVLWCDTEGTSAITVQRLKDWGMPFERIKVPFEDDPLRSVDLEDPDHMERIEDVVNRYKIQLVVVDSLRGAHGGDENSSKITPVLQSLASIAERTRTAIVIIHHTKKVPDDQEINADSSRGSNAIVAMVRAQLAIDQPDKTSKWCRVRMLKENLGLRPQPVGFLVTGKGLDFGDAPRKPEKQVGHQKAADWLLEQMEPGTWYKAKPLQEAAEAAGFPPTGTLQKAREELGIVKPNIKKEGRVSWWRLPTN
ncbi:MAG: AAA family ATPase [Chloroflexi bacterium]|nr:AAA family ATPase [Chloroflexota bacterium]